MFIGVGRVKSGVVYEKLNIYQEGLLSLRVQFLQWAHLHHFLSVDLTKNLT